MAPKWQGGAVGVAQVDSLTPSDSSTDTAVAFTITLTLDARQKRHLLRDRCRGLRGGLGRGHTGAPPAPAPSSDVFLARPIAGPSPKRRSIGTPSGSNHVAARCGLLGGCICDRI